MCIVISALGDALTHCTGIHSHRNHWLHKDRCLARIVHMFQNLLHMDTVIPWMEECMACKSVTLCLGWFTFLPVFHANGAWSLVGLIVCILSGYSCLSLLSLSIIHKACVTMHLCCEAHMHIHACDVKWNFALSTVACKVSSSGVSCKIFCNRK